MIAGWGDNQDHRPSSSTAPTPVSSRTSPSRRSKRSVAGRWTTASPRTGRLETALADGRLQRSRPSLGVKVIHISERDTQITSQPKEVNEFVNTWSVEGFYEEGIAPAEMGWGTHEKRLPALASQHAGDGPGNQICLAQMACKTWVRSWVPAGEITRHGDPAR